MTLFLWYCQYQRTDLIWKRAYIMHTLFHIRTYAYPFPYEDCYHPERPISARGLLSSRETYIDQRALGGPRVDIGWGMIPVLKWKKACINLFITYFNIELKRKKLTSHTDTKLIWIWVINIGWGMITILLWKKSCIDLFIERFDIMLSDFCLTRIIQALSVSDSLNLLGLMKRSIESGI